MEEESWVTEKLDNFLVALLQKEANKWIKSLQVNWGF